MSNNSTYSSENFRVTGPPENFITAMTIGYWALNEKNEAMWNRLRKGDILLFHSTTTSNFGSSLTSGIVGYARVGSRKFRKNGHWWIQEIENDQNIWPLAFSLDHICLVEDFSGIIDLDSGVHEKPIERMRREVLALANSGIPIRRLNERA